MEVEIPRLLEYYETQGFLRPLEVTIIYEFRALVQASYISPSALKLQEIDERISREVFRMAYMSYLRQTTPSDRRSFGHFITGTQTRAGELEPVEDPFCITRRSPRHPRRN
jgi:hypothetical protein